MARFGLPATLILLSLVTGCATIPGEGVVRLGEGIDDRWIVRWNDALGTPSLMTNLALQDVYVAPDTPAVDDSTARAAVTRVVARESASFRIRPGVDDLVPVSSRVSRWIRIVRLQQVYRGVPVLGAGYDAHVFPNGRVGTIEGRFQPDLHLQVAPLVGPRQAEERARARAPGEVPPALRYDLWRRSSDPTLVIVPIADRMVLAWIVETGVTPRERQRFVVDAQTAEVIGR